MSTFIENYQRVLQDKGKMSGSQWVFYCPFEGCVGYTKRKFFVDPSRGFWCCKHCNKEVPDKVYRTDTKEASGGTWKEFVLLTGDDPSLWPTETMTDSSVDPKARPLTAKQRRKVWTALFENAELTWEHEQEVIARGINPTNARVMSSTPGLLKEMEKLFDPTILERAGLFYCSKGALHPRLCIALGRILIPYYENEEVFYFVGYMKCPKRADNQAIEDYQVMRSDWKKIAGPAGYTPAIYGDIPEEAEYVVITEGQFKAEAARQQGIICVGLQGRENGHATVAKKCAELKVKRAIVMFDTEAEDQEANDYSSEKLGRELLKVGIPAFRATLPLETSVDRGLKMDIDSYLLHYGVSNFCELLFSAQPYKIREELIEDDEEDI